jgi:hypothetical protein
MQQQQPVSKAHNRRPQNALWSSHHAASNWSAQRTRVSRDAVAGVDADVQDVVHRVVGEPRVVDVPARRRARRWRVDALIQYADLALHSTEPTHNERQAMRRWQRKSRSPQRTIVSLAMNTPALEAGKSRVTLPVNVGVNDGQLLLTAEATDASAPRHAMRTTGRRIDGWGAKM